MGYLFSVPSVAEKKIIMKTRQNIQNLVRLSADSKFKTQHFILILALVSFVLFLSSCSSPTENNKVTFSGVTVSLYAPVELDTALVRINQHAKHADQSYNKWESA